jgi:hypothetical protein
MSITVSRRAALARIQRRLAKEDERLVKIRETSGDFVRYGPYMIVDIGTKGVIEGGWTLEGLAKEFEILKPFEKLDKE